MTAEELKLLFEQPLVLLVLMLLASLGSAFKQMVVARRSDATVTPWNYFARNWPETIIMLGQNAVAFVGLLMTDSLNWAAALGAGYVANDSADIWTKAGRSVALTAVKSHWLVAVVSAMLMVTMLSGCGVLEAAKDNPVTTRFILQQATSRLIEAEKTPEARTARAERILKFTGELRTWLDFDGVTVDQLEAKVLERIAKSDLSVPDQSAAEFVLAYGIGELRKRIGDGPNLIPPDKKITVNELLAAVESAAEKYGA